MFLKNASEKEAFFCGMRIKNKREKKRMGGGAVGC